MMRAMTSYKLVMPGDLNHYGFLFGGKMLMWVDEVAWMGIGSSRPSDRQRRLNGEPRQVAGLLANPREET